jgi:hypothetical protein
VAQFTASVLIKADSNLSDSMKRIAKSTDKATKSTKKLSKSFKIAEKAGKKMGQSVVRWSRRGSIALGAFSIAAFKLSSDADEVASKFNVVFRGVSRGADKTARSFAKDFGLAQTTAKQLLANTGDLLSGIGFTDEASLGLSTRLNALAVDLASFSNIQGGARRASEALTKGLLGERESMKLLGIAIREEDISKELEKRGLQGLKGRELRAAKALITFDLAFEQSAKAIGDFERTSDSAANQMRLTAERLKEFSERFGNEVIAPLAKNVLPAINKFLGDEERVSALLDKIKSAVEKTADAIVAIRDFGQAAAQQPIVRRFREDPLEAAFGFRAFRESLFGEQGLLKFSFPEATKPEAATSEVELRIHSPVPVSVEKIDEKTDVFIFPELGVMTP